MKSNSIPALYPSRERRAGLREVARSAARFIQTFGYWPKIAEMAEFMGSPKHAVQWYAEDLIAEGILERRKLRSGHSCVRLTAKGWAVLGVQPVEPYVSRTHVMSNQRDSGAKKCAEPEMRLIGANQCQA